MGIGWGNYPGYDWMKHSSSNNSEENFSGEERPIKKLLCIFIAGLPAYTLFSTNPHSPHLDSHLLHFSSS